MGISPYLANLLLQSQYVPASHVQPPNGPVAPDQPYDIQGAQDRALRSVYDPTEALGRQATGHLDSVLANLKREGAIRDQQQAGTIAKILAMKHWSEDNPYPQQEELQSQGAYPRFQSPQVPERGPAQVDPSSRFLAGIAAAFAPGQFRGDILASPLHGALEHANQVYQDKIKSYQMHYQEAQQQHEDDLNARNEEAKRQAYNASARYGNKLGAYNAAHEDLLNVGAPLASIQTQMGVNPAVTKAEEEAATAGATEQNIGEEIKARQEQSKEKSHIVGLYGTASEHLAADYLKQGGMNSRAAAAEAGRMSRDEMRDMIRAAIGGYQFTPGQSGQPAQPFQPGSLPGTTLGGPQPAWTPPTLSATPLNKLSEVAKAKVSRDQASAAANNERVQKMMAEVNNIKSGRSSDLTKATPEERLALSKLKGARDVYLATVRKRADYMAKQGPNADFKGDTTYTAMANAEVAASIQYQNADARATSLVQGRAAAQPKGLSIRPKTSADPLGIR